MATTISRRCSDGLPNFETPGYQNVFFHAVNMLKNTAKMPFTSLAVANIAALT